MNVDIRSDESDIKPCANDEGQILLLKDEIISAWNFRMVKVGEVFSNGIAAVGLVQLIHDGDKHCLLLSL